MQRRVSFDNGDYSPVSVAHGGLCYLDQGENESKSMIVIGSAFCAREIAKALLAYADAKELETRDAG